MAQEYCNKRFSLRHYSELYVQMIWRFITAISSRSSVSLLHTNHHYRCLNVQRTNCRGKETHYKLLDQCNMPALNSWPLWHSNSEPVGVCT